MEGIFCWLHFGAMPSTTKVVASCHATMLSRICVAVLQGSQALHGMTPVVLHPASSKCLVPCSGTCNKLALLSRCHYKMALYFKLIPA